MRPVVRRFSQLRRALANAELRRVQVAWTGCITAETAQTVGLAIVAHRLAGLYGVGTLGLVRTMPPAFIGPFVASMAARLPRAEALLSVLVVRAVAVGIVGVAVVVDLPAVVVFAVAALDAVVYSVWWPTHSALLPELSRSPSEATAANVSTTVIENLGTLAGPLLGAACVTIGGAGAVFGVAFALLAASAFTIVGVARAHRDRHRDVGEAPHSLTAGFRVAAFERHPRTVLSLYLLQTLCLGAIGVLVVALALDTLAIGERGVGLLNASMGAGGLAGAFGAVGLVGRRTLGTTLGVALVIWGAAVVTAGTVPHVAVVVVVLAVVGMGNAVVDVAALTLFQRTVPSASLVQLLGVFEGLWWAMLGAGAFAGAVVVDAGGVQTALVVTGALLAATVVVLSRALRAVDSAAGPPPDVLARLARVPFFAALPPAALERVAFEAEAVAVDAGVPVIRQGEPGETFYVIVDGELDVYAPEGENRMGPDDSFGEIALLRDVPRTATVVARTPCRLLAVQREVFLDAVRGGGGAAGAIG